ncbi:hypothetical protein KEM52_005243 [Ascosphaera acerosa]|nr:hypothetical protein KEM52_005243 [Ascosphaera acerosa]
MAAPYRKSLFERQKAEARAKQRREQEETAAVFEDFVKSFERDERSIPRGPTAVRNAFERDENGGRHGGGSTASDAHHAGLAAPITGPSKRHFTSRGMGLGRGLGMPPLGRKMGFEPSRSSQGVTPTADSEKGSHDRHEGPLLASKAFAGATANDDDGSGVAIRDEDDERAAARPTLRLASLPPGTSPAAVKALIPSNVTVDSVKIISPATSSSVGASMTPQGDARLWSAIVTVAHDTAAAELDAVVTSLQNRYLGWGHYLSISRHLSSVTLDSVLPVSTAGLTPYTTKHPFGARQVHSRHGPGGRFAPPGSGRRGGYAPPPSYEPGARYQPKLEVVVSPPSDLRQLKLIHKTIQAILSHGPEFEALLMSRPEVQRDEKWAWIWNSRSRGGVYYRWKLWDVLTGATLSRTQARDHRRDARPEPVAIFTAGPVWLPPVNPLRFEHITGLDDIVSDEDYDSSEDEESDREEERRRRGDAGAGDSTVDDSADGTGILDPMGKAKLTHLLVKLPTSNAKLRRGDIAAVTSCAIRHASRGADEVVDMIVSNVARPFVNTGANPDHKPDHSRAARGASETETAFESPAPADDPSAHESDDSAARLVGLYVISDILSTSSTSGVRHAWRYRQLFEAAFKAHKTFESLGRAEKEQGWGRLKSDKWRRSVLSILSQWEGWCVFSQDSHEHFVRMFTKPPLTAAEEAAVAAAAAAEAAEAERVNAEEKKARSRWKSVEDTAPFSAAADAMDVDAEESASAQHDLDGQPMPDSDSDDYDSLDGWPLADSSDEDVDGEETAMEVDDGRVAVGDEHDAGVSINARPSPLAAGPAPAGQALEATIRGSAPATGPQGEPAFEQATPPAWSSAFTSGPGRGRPAPRPRPKAADMFADSGSE